MSSNDFAGALFVTLIALYGCATTPDEHHVGEEAAQTSKDAGAHPLVNVHLPGDAYYCGSIERRSFDVGVPTPFVVLTTSVDSESVEVTLTSTMDNVSKALGEVKLPLTPGWTACAHAERASEDWTFGQVLHIDAFYTKAPDEPASSP